MSTEVESVALEACSDVELFALLRSGSQQAFRALFRRHQRPVYLTALRVLRTSNDAEEIIQDTFLTLWNKRRKIDLAGDSTLPWLLTTARYLALNRMRANSRIQTEPLGLNQDVAEKYASADAQLEGNELVQQLDSMVAAMPQVDQEIFNLCLVEGVNYEQAAKRLGITHGSVRNRLSRLKGKLRSQLNVAQEGQQS